MRAVLLLVAMCLLSCTAFSSPLIPVDKDAMTEVQNLCVPGYPTLSLYKIKGVFETKAAFQGIKEGLLPSGIPDVEVLKTVRSTPFYGALEDCLGHDSTGRLLAKALVAEIIMVRATNQFRTLAQVSIALYMAPEILVNLVFIDGVPFLTQSKWLLTFISANPTLFPRLRFVILGALRAVPGFYFLRKPVNTLALNMKRFNDMAKSTSNSEVISAGGTSLDSKDLETDAQSELKEFLKEDLQNCKSASDCQKVRESLERARTITVN